MKRWAVSVIVHNGRYWQKSQTVAVDASSMSVAVNRGLKAVLSRADRPRRVRAANLRVERVEMPKPDDCRGLVDPYGVAS